MNRRRPMRPDLIGRTRRGKKAHWQAWFWILAACFSARSSRAQDDVAEKVKQLTEAMSRVQAQLNESQKQLEELRQQLAALQGASAPAGEQNGASDAAKLAAQVEDLRERQALQETQIAVQEQAKVESESKYPVKLSGLVLMTGFANTGNVDMAATPTIAIPGSGSSGAPPNRKSCVTPTCGLQFHKSPDQARAGSATAVSELGAFGLIRGRSSSKNASVRVQSRTACAVRRRSRPAPYPPL